MRLSRDTGVVLLAALFIIMISFVFAHRAWCGEEEWPTTYYEDVCPVEYDECLQFDIEHELERAHMLFPHISPIGVSSDTSDRRRQIEDWELESLSIIMGGVLGKDYHDLVETDCGAHGFAHFQPPNGLNLSEFEFYEESENDGLIETCWIDDQPKWVFRLEEVLYSPYGIALQLTAWRDTVDYAIYRALERGWVDEELTLVASLTNSTGARGFLDLADEHDWDPHLVIQGYMDQRPDSDHRRRRAQRLQELF